MECPNCPNDETFFKRDGVDGSHLCGICGASIMVRSQSSMDNQPCAEHGFIHPDNNIIYSSSETLLKDKMDVVSLLSSDESPSCDSLKHANDKYLRGFQSKNRRLASCPSIYNLQSSVCIEESDLLNADSHQNYELLRKKYVALLEDFRGLESTLEELMVAYEAQIEATQKLQSDYRASDELRELEICRLRVSYREEQSRADIVEAARIELSSICSQLRSNLELMETEKDRTRAECLEIEEKFIQLKQQAERKLKLAEEKVKVTISSYSALQENYSLLENEFSLLNSRYSSCSSELKQKESHCTELTANVQSLLDLLKEKDQEIANSETLIATTQQELQIAKQKLNDIQEMNCRFKAGLVRVNEDNRCLKEKIAQMETIEKENLEQRSRIDLLTIENSNLKSRIFDAMEVEKTLRQELFSSNSATREGSSVLEELELLRKDLQEKTIENKELLEISKELLDNLECTTLRSSLSTIKTGRAI